MNKIVTIVFAAIIGAIFGYWYRGQVQIAREQAAIHEFIAGPPHVLSLAPPSSEPLPWTPGWSPKTQPRNSK